MLAVHGDAERTRERVRDLIEHQERHGFSKWGVKERASGVLVGDCGMQLLEGGPDVELGYHFRPSVWGRGYATEAAGACLAEAFTKLGIDRVIAIVEPGNAASVRVLEKIGMRPAGERRALGRTWDLYTASGP